MQVKRINTYHYLSDLAPANIGDRNKNGRICFYHFIVTDKEDNPITEETFVSAAAANQFIAERQ